MVKFQAEAERMSTRAAAAAGSGGQRVTIPARARAVGETKLFLVWVRIPVGVEKTG